MEPSRGSFQMLESREGEKFHRLNVPANSLGASQVVLVVRSPLANAEDVDSPPGSGRSPGGGHATHSSILAWRTPWTEEPGRLGLLGLQRVAHDRSNITCTQETVWRLIPCSPFSSCHCVIDTADTLPSFLRNFFTNFMPPSPSFCPPATKHTYFWASLVSQTVKNLPAMWEAQVWFLG